MPKTSVHGMTVRVDDDLFYRFHMAMACRGQYRQTDALREAVGLYIARYGDGGAARPPQGQAPPQGAEPQGPEAPVRPAPEAPEAQGDDGQPDINDILAGMAQDA